MLYRAKETAHRTAWLIAALLVIVLALLKAERAGGQEPPKSPGRCGTVTRIDEVRQDTVVAVLQYPTAAIKEPIPFSADSSTTIGKSYLVKYTGGELERVIPVPNCSAMTLAQVRKGLIADRFAQKLDSILKPPHL